MSLRSTAFLMAVLVAGPAGAVRPYAQELTSSVVLALADEQYQDYGYDYRSWGFAGTPSTPVPLSTTGEALARDPLTGGRIAATTEAFSELTGPLTGTMRVAATLDIAAPDSADAGQQATFRTYMLLRYFSEDDRDADISVSYSLSSINPDLFASDTALNFWLVGWRDGYEILGNVGQNRTGVFNSHCPARVTCWLSIAGYSELAAAFLPVGQGSFAGQFDWSIVENRDVLPEPATWAMLVTGFAALGTSLRRRRSGTHHKDNQCLLRLPVGAELADGHLDRMSPRADRFRSSQ